MKIGLYGTELKQDFKADIEALIDRVFKDAKELWIENTYAKVLEKGGVELPEYISFSNHRDIEGKLDLLLSIGGDGTFLSTLTLIRDSGIPVLGINTGRLGFLAYVAPDRIQQSMDAVFAKKFSVKGRSLLSVRSENSAIGDANYALNEVAVHKKDSSSMITIHIEIDGKFLTSYWADGLIISTPTGSTAYNLSCGGPIVAPNTECLVITPKAPHNLTVRPLVVKDDVELKMRVECRDDQFLLSLDSRSVSCHSETEIVIRKADFNMNIVRPEGSRFFKTMRRKLKWGLDSRN
jgi:NAD+ kinase